MKTSAGAQAPLRALERAIRKAGTAKAWAVQAGVSEAYVSDIRLGRRDPGPAVLAALGLERVVRYRPATAEARS
jgi:DNA-binding transcriptional regulator YdaS (Cro superfamily)